MQSQLSAEHFAVDIAQNFFFYSSHSSEAFLVITLYVSFS
jgi:hypothetical protein